MTKKSVNRYHKNFFFPNWSGHQLAKFMTNLAENSMSILFTPHAVDKITADTVKYGQEFRRCLLKVIRNIESETADIFEFYADEKSIKKICIRYSFEDFPFDIVLVISYQGIVITVYTTKKGDYHASLNENLYEKGE